MGKEITKRTETKWVKITHTGRNKYIVAFGLKGATKAHTVNSGSKVWSEVAVDYYLADA